MLSLLEAANRIANLPEILPEVARGYDGIDLTPFFNKSGNHAIGDAGGMALFVSMGDGAYEGHYLFSPQARNKMADCKVYIAWMFTRGGASSIVGRVPVDNLRARAITRALGFTPTGTSVSSTGRSCVNYTLERDTWAILSAESLGA